MKPNTYVKIVSSGIANPVEELEAFIQGEEIMPLQEDESVEVRSSAFNEGNIIIFRNRKSREVLSVIHTPHTVYIQEQNKTISTHRPYSSFLFGMDDERKLSWTDVITFGKNSGNEMLAVLLRDEIRGLAERQQFGNATMLSGIITKTIANSFKRKQMKDFEYLKDDYSPSGNAVMGFVIFQIILLTGMTIFFYNFDLQRGDWHSRSTSSSLLRQLHVPRYSINRLVS